MGRHVIEALGKTRVVIEDGKVIEVGEPQIKYCPLFAKKQGIEEITPEIVRENVEFRIRDFGMCTPERQLRMKDFLSFGVSELIGTAISTDMLDCAVIVCEGAGTVVVTDPELVQGIGGRVSGLVSTTLMPEIIDKLGHDRVLSTEECVIDQVKGTKLAQDLGYCRIGVTICFAEDATRIRQSFGQTVALFAVHTTGRTSEEAEEIFRQCDIVTGCASKTIRTVARSKALFQVGSKVPVYAASLWGKMLLEKRLEMTKIKNVTSPEEPPRPLI
ncbi:MAG: methanogenesis marker 8 protein [Methanomassiliicoccales archaeon]|jgi:putative methanogenesis marker protein 8